MAFQLPKLFWKARAFVLACVISLFFCSNINATDKNLLALSQADISEYIESLNFDEYRNYNVTQLYLLNRKLSKPENAPKNIAILNRLKQIAEWSVRPIVTVERINVHFKRKDKSEILNIFLDLAKSPEADLYEDRIINILIGSFSVNAEPDEIRNILKQLLPVLNRWRQDSIFMVWALSYLDVGDVEYTELIKELWAISDMTVFPRSYTPYLTQLKENPVEAQDIVARHFSSQYQLKNWSYVTTEAPNYLARLPRTSTGFSKVREVYIKTFFRKRQYSQLIQQLNTPTQAQVLSFTEGEKAELFFRLWLKKGSAANAAKYLILLEKSVPAKEMAIRYFEMAEFLYQKKHLKKSLGYLNRIKPGMTDEDLFQLVQWRKLMIYHELENFKEMEEIAHWADSYLFQSREIGAKFCYWGVKLKLYEQRAALSCYQRFPFTYYGFRSFQSGDTYSGTDKSFLTSLNKKDQSSLSQRELSFLSFVHVLYLSDETDLADALVKRYLKKHFNTPFLRRLTEILYQAERYYLQQQLIDLFFKEDLYNGSNDQNQFLMAYYPNGYRGEVSRHTGQSEVLPGLVYAVIREESNFRAEVESPAGAVGLMQLMPSTAKYIAEISRMKYEPTLLIDPDTNVRLGVAYLNRLLRRYKGNLFYTLAAYNGGATNVKRWIRITGDRDLDFFVESITFIETQNYVKRVLRSFYIYQMLYD